MRFPLKVWSARLRRQQRVRSKQRWWLSPGRRKRGSTDFTASPVPPQSSLRLLRASARLCLSCRCRTESRSRRCCRLELSCSRAAVLLLAALGLFAPGRAAVVRPAVGVLWTTVVMGVAAVMQSAVIATDVPGVGLGAGAFALCGAAFLAAATGLLVWLAGSAEREDVDTSVVGGSRGLVLLVGGIGAVAVLIGTALPLYRGDAYTAASVLEWPWGIDVWGQLLVGVTVVIAAVIAASARPARGAALLIGSAVAALVYVSEWPLTSSRISDATVGVGAITAATGIVLLLVAAFSSARISETDA